MKMKKICYGLISLGLLTSSSIALAGAYNPPEPAATQPCSLLCSAPMKSGFYVGVTGLYLTPSETGIGLFTDSWQYTDPNTGKTTSKSKPFDPDGNWSVGAKLGYNFGESANNLEFDYFYLNNKTHAVNDSSGNPSSFGSVFFNINIPNPASIDLVSDAHLEYTVNQYDLWFGHTYSQSPDGFMFKPAIGVRFADLEHDMTFAAPGYVKSSFQGVGPELGFDVRQGFSSSGFGLVGHFDAALLASSVDGSSGLAFPPLNEEFKSPSQERVSSAFTGKLGLDYRHTFSNESMIAIEGGYQATRYSDAFDIVEADAVIPVVNQSGTVVGATQQIQDIHTDNFSFMGPYLSLTYYI